MPPATPDLASLRRRIQAIESGGGPAAVLPLGIAAVDAALPGGGLVLNGLHEIMGAGTDEEDGAVAAAFAAGLLARLARRRGAPILWCLAADDLYGPGLAAHGLMPDRLVLARCRNDGDILWAMEEGRAAPSSPRCWARSACWRRPRGAACSSPPRRAASRSSRCAAGGAASWRRASARRRARR